MGLRESYGALKDSTTVNFGKISSQCKDLDVAIVKATNHVEAPPMERYIRKIFAATSVVRPRTDAAYCIHALARRLARTSNWIVAIKVLMVIHGTLREGDPFFTEMLVNHSYWGRVLHLPNFKDGSGHHVKALGIYKRAGLQAETLADIYDYCKRLTLATNFQFPTLRQPPSSFLATMEEYVKEAPQTGSTWERQDIKEKDESSHKEETPEAAEGQPAKQETEAENEQQEPELLIECESPPMICTDDFLGFNDFEPKAAETEESSLPTIAISSNGTDPPLPNTGLGGTGWGMALFSATTSNTTPAPESSVGVGIYKQLHSNLYEEDTTI